MIISDSHKFIYFHIPKTGGTSFTYLLSRYSNNYNKYEKLKELVDLLEQHYPEVENISEIDSCVVDCYNSMPQDDINLFYRKNPDKIRWLNMFHEGLGPHIVLHENKRHSTSLLNHKGLYDGYFRFAFIRNPWDYVFSIFKNKIVIEEVARIWNEDLDWDEEVAKRTTKDNFNDFICNAHEHIGLYRSFLNPDVNQCNYILSKTGELVTNYIARFENYNIEIDRISTILDIDLSSEVKLNVSDETVKNYTEYYNGKSIKFVNETFNQDITLFGYKYGV
jgi:hypothetical protein